MLYVLDDGTIRLMRGDTARFTIPITNETNGAEYPIQSGDILCLTIKKSGKDYEPLIQKSVKGTNVTLTSWWFYVYVVGQRGDERINTNSVGVRQVLR